MTIDEVREKYLNFFKDRGHKVIPSASLVPENDSTTLLTGSGMQALLPYLLGKDHPEGKRLVNSQKCLRAEDVDEVGDNRHTTFFEMLGNWSLGDYFKEEQISWISQFLFEEVGLDPTKLYITCFSGDSKFDLEKDEQSAKVWQKIYQEKNLEAKIIELGSVKNGAQKGMQDGRIFYYDSSKNWWSRSGKPESMPAGEPGGPDSEMFYEFEGVKHDKKYGENCHPNCDCGRFIEIGNSVFMQYLKQEDGSFKELPKKNVDFGGGLERMAMAANDSKDIFILDVFQKIIQEIEKVSGKKYEENKEAFRVIADHMRAAVFLIADGVRPFNEGAGYFVRRLIRRAALKVNKLNQDKLFALAVCADFVAEVYKNVYPQLLEKTDEIAEVIREEETMFAGTLRSGIKQFNRLEDKDISGDDLFKLVTTHGLPIELVQDLAKESNISLDIESFKEKMKEHQKVSRAGAEKKFKGGLADSSEKTTALHTATHLMLAGLRKYLGADIHQAGSNITAERTRFDFNYPEKVSREVLDKVEDYVNEAIKKSAEVKIIQMPKEQAKKEGVEGSFWEKYPNNVDVYQIQAGDTIYSKELCGGPHVQNTSEIKGKFKIIKEQSSSAGIRRIKAVLEE